LYSGSDGLAHTTKHFALYASGQGVGAGVGDAVAEKEAGREVARARATRMQGRMQCIRGNAGCSEWNGSKIGVAAV
jgi:hypothetical protein